MFALHAFTVRVGGRRIADPVILMSDGIGAFVKTYRVWNGTGCAVGVSGRGLALHCVDADVPVNSGGGDTGLVNPNRERRLCGKSRTRSGGTNAR